MLCDELTGRNEPDDDEGDVHDPGSAKLTIRCAAAAAAWDLRLNADQFERVCQANPDALLILSADGQLIATTPAGTETGARNKELLLQLPCFAISSLATWNRQSNIQMPKTGEWVSHEADERLPASDLERHRFFAVCRQLDAK